MLLLLKSLGLKSILIVTVTSFSPSVIRRVPFFQLLSLHFHLIIVASSLQASFALADIYWVVQLITLETGTLFVHLRNPGAAAKLFFLFISLLLAPVRLQSRLLFGWYIQMHQKMILHPSLGWLPHQQIPAECVHKVNAPLISYLTFLRLLCLTELLSGQNKSFLFLVEDGIV